MLAALAFSPLIIGCGVPTGKVLSARLCPCRSQRELSKPGSRLHAASVHAAVLHSTYVNGGSTEGDVFREFPIHGAGADREHRRRLVGHRVRPRARVAGRGHDGDLLLDCVQRADRDRVGEVVSRKVRAEGHGNRVHAVGHRLDDGREHVEAGTSRLVTRLVRGHARARGTARRAARSVAEQAGARDGRATRGGQCVRAVTHVVTRRGQVLLARRLAFVVVAQLPLQLDALAEEPRADELPAYRRVPTILHAHVDISDRPAGGQRLCS
jgi:hypothetical protein